MVDVKVTNLVKLYTLLLLKKRPMHGYELIKELELSMLRDISASHVYPFLQILQKNKLITLKESGKREKKQYQLSKSGEKFAQSMIDKFAEIMEISISKDVKTCALCKCKLVSGWHNEKISGKNLTFCCARCAMSYKGK